MEYLTLAMVWVLSGLFVSSLMRSTDERIERNNADGKKRYWLKNRPDANLRILWSIIGAPVALLLSFAMVMDE
jgi:hypothetical protein